MYWKCVRCNTMIEDKKANLYYEENEVVKVIGCDNCVKKD